MSNEDKPLPKDEKPEEEQVSKDEISSPEAIGERSEEKKDKAEKKIQETAQSLKEEAEKAVDTMVADRQDELVKGVETAISESIEDKTKQVEEAIDVDKIVDEVANEIKQKIPKYFSVSPRMKDSRTAKFIRSTGKTMAFALIPLIIIIVGVTYNLAIIDQFTFVDTTAEYETVVLNKYSTTFREQAEFIDQTLSTLKQRTNDLATKMAVKPTKLEIPNYGLNDTTPNPTLSRRHNQTIDLLVSSYFLLEGTNQTADVNDTLAYSAQYDPLLMSTYQTNPQFLYIRIHFLDGVVRTYPYLQQNVTGFTPTKYTWFNQTRANPTSTDVIVSDVEADIVTGRQIINFARNLFVNGTNVGVLQMAIDISFAKSPLSGMVSATVTPFLLSKEGNVIYHPLFAQGRTFGWNETNVKANITSVDNQTEVLLPHISKAFGGTPQSVEISVNNSRTMLWVFPINSTGAVLGATFDFPKLQIKSTFDVLSLYGIPALSMIVFGFLFLFLQFRFGWFKGMTLQEAIDKIFEKLHVDAITERFSKSVNALSPEKLFSTATKATADRIKEKGEELRDQLEEKIEEKTDTIADQVTDALSALDRKIIDTLEDVDEALAEKLDKTKIVSKVLQGISENPYAYLQNKIKAKGIDVAKIRQGDFSSLTKLVTEPERMMVAMLANSNIPLTKMAEITGLKERELEHFFGSLPHHFGISVDDESGSVLVDNELLVKSTPEFVKYMNAFMKDPKEYLKALPGNNYEKLEKLVPAVKTFMPLLMTEKKLDYNTVAKSLGLPSEDVKSLFKSLEKQDGHGIKAKKKYLEVDHGKLRQNLPKLSNAMIQEIIENYL